VKRILILSSEFPPGPGGIGTHAYQLAKYLSKQHMEVTVVSPQDYANETEINAFNGKQPFKVERLPSIAIKPFQTLKRFQALKSTFRALKPTLVIASGTRAIWMTAFLLKWQKIPWVIIGHGKEFGRRKGGSALLTKVSGNRANAVICVSHFTLSRLHKMGITKPPSYVIHNGADHHLFYKLPKEEVKAFLKEQSLENPFILLTVGNVSDRKGQEVVIRSLPRIKKVIPNVQYWMAGLPERQMALEALARALEVGDNIRFWGRVPHTTLLALYNACNLFVMTSRQVKDGDFEGYGIAVIEAALCGKASVVSDNSGLTEAVIHDKTGLLVPQDDPAGTAEAVLTLTRNPQILERLSRNAQQNAIENQTWEKVGARYLQLMDKICNE